MSDRESLLEDKAERLKELLDSSLVATRQAQRRLARAQDRVNRILFSGEVCVMLEKDTASYVLQVLKHEAMLPSTFSRRPLLNNAIASFKEGLSE